MSFMDHVLLGLFTGNIGTFTLVLTYFPVDFIITYLSNSKKGIFMYIADTVFANQSTFQFVNMIKYSHLM